MYELISALGFFYLAIIFVLIGMIIYGIIKLLPEILKFFFIGVLGLVVFAIIVFLLLMLGSL